MSVTLHEVVLEALHEMVFGLRASSSRIARRFVSGGLGLAIGMSRSPPHSPLLTSLWGAEAYLGDGGWAAMGG